MKIMVCLISGQHVPNLLTVKSIKPDRLVLLVTPGMKTLKKDSQFLKALAVGGLDYSSNKDIIDQKEENSSIAVYCNLQEAFKNHPNDEWIINLTGGTKPMSIGAYEFSKNKGLKTLYIAEGNQHQAIDLLGGPSITLDHKVTTEEFLAGYGFDIINKESLKRSEERALKWMTLAAILAKHSDEADLRIMLSRLQKFKEAAIKFDKDSWEDNGLTLSEDDDVFLKDQDLRTQIASYFGLSTIGAKFIGRLDRHAVEFLTGKWLEVFVWSLLQSFVNKGIWDLHLGVSAGKSGPGENNDLDVSFMRNQSLCIVECKTGGQEHDPEADDVLYKIEAIKSGPKALRVETYLATTSDNVKDSHKGGIREKLQRRSRIYGCKIIPGWTIKEMADHYLSSDPKLSQEIADVFGLKTEASL
ncbi:MAG: DUF1887 family CARF protein [Methanotrichaceae archaeon]